MYHFENRVVYVKLEIKALEYYIDSFLICTNNVNLNDDEMKYRHLYFKNKTLRQSIHHKTKRNLWLLLLIDSVCLPEMVILVTYHYHDISKINNIIIMTCYTYPFWRSLQVLPGTQYWPNCVENNILKNQTKPLHFQQLKKNHYTSMW